MGETAGELMAGFGVALTPLNLLWGLIGVTLGTFVGVLPGVGPALTVAMLMPITVKLDPTGVLIMFAGIYYGAMYGGSTTTILLNTPGEVASIATALEGTDGQARPRGPALATAAIGRSSPARSRPSRSRCWRRWWSRSALKLRPRPEYFALMVLVLTMCGRARATGAPLG